MSKILLFLKGVAMGASDIIPGVSGGTIAFITGIYDELIDALSSFNLTTLKYFFTGKWKSFWKAIHGNFLVLVFGGILVSIISLVKLIHFLLQTYPSLLWAFFFGLILASALILRKSIKKWRHKYLIWAIVGLVVWYGITTLPIIHMWIGSASIFFSWFFAIIAMILPGISGSYILLVLSQYHVILQIIVDVVNGLQNFLHHLGDWSILMAIPFGKLLLFLLWAVIGLLSFSKLLHYIKKRRHNRMVVVLTGFMIGSLNKVWPWKETISTFVDKQGKVQPLLQKNILPHTGEQILWGIGFLVLGLAIVLLLHYFSQKRVNHLEMN